MSATDNDGVDQNVQKSSSDEETTEVDKLLQNSHDKDLTRGLGITLEQDGTRKVEQLDIGNDDNTPDAVLYQLGGCGRYQFLISFVIQAMKTVVCWGLVGNAFFSYEPEWRCSSIPAGNESATNDSESTRSLYVTSSSRGTTMAGYSNSSKAPYWNKLCYADGGDVCKGVEFAPGMHTLVSEFDLVCDQSWVTATIVSVQMVGMCVGSVVGGQISDLFGRKRPIIAAMAILSLFHLISYFSVNWMMFAACRFFIGMGSAFYLTIYCTIQAEFDLSKWRPVVIGFPSWALESALFSLVAWLVPNWKVLALLISALSLAFMSAYFFIPESFRWYVAKGRLKEVDELSKTIARWNKHPAPNHEKIRKMLLSTQADENQSKVRCLTGLLDLFRITSLLKLTLPLMVCWITMGFIAYGIYFGVMKLSGSIFLNIFFISVCSIPSKIVSILLQNKFGRKIAFGIAIVIAGASGLLVGILHNVDIPNKDTLINTFVFVAIAGVDGTWGPMQTLTVEVYPTIVRNVGFGLVSVLARFGAVLGPQFVYLGEKVPGILYFTIALTSLLSVLSLFCLPETMDSVLLDKITEDLEKHRRKERNV